VTSRMRSLTASTRRVVSASSRQTPRRGPRGREEAVLRGRRDTDETRLMHNRPWTGDAGTMEIQILGETDVTKEYAIAWRPARPWERSQRPAKRRLSGRLSACPSFSFSFAVVSLVELARPSSTSIDYIFSSLQPIFFPTLHTLYIALGMESRRVRARPPWRLASSRPVRASPGPHPTTRIPSAYAHT
jgi:hypothetical protein